MADKGGRTVVEMMTLADKGEGGGGLDIPPPFLADIFFVNNLSLLWRGILETKCLVTYSSI